MMKELFGQILERCPGYDGSGGPPVMNVSVRATTNAQTGQGSTFAFVEFRDEKLSNTAAKLNGMELMGRNLKISHPNGYVPPQGTPDTYDLPEDLMKRFGLGSYEAMRRQDRPPAELADRKARELYVGNLTIGCVTSQMLVDLFTAPLQALPLENAASPVTEAKVDQSAKFAFVLFADDQLATMALALFNKMELCGRPMCVDRPAGYTPDMSTPLPPGLMASGMPQGGLGAPPEKAAAAAAVTAAAAASRAKPQPAAAPTPTRHLCLMNALTAKAMSDRQELSDCEEDIRLECGTYGAVTACQCVTPFEMHGHGEDALGKIFIRYEHLAAALKAQEALNGREFDGNKVSATFLPE